MKSGTKDSGLVLFGVADVTLVADSQLPAPLGTAARQNGAAVGRLHASAEPVRLGPSAIIRLKSTFWHILDQPGQAVTTEAPMWTQVSLAQLLV